MRSTHLYCRLLLVLVLGGSLYALYASIWNNSTNDCCTNISVLTLGNMTPDTVITEMVERADESEIYATTYALQSIPTRQYGSEGNREAARYLHERLSAISGLEVEYQGGDLRNIIAVLPGINGTPDDMVIVGAHYDSEADDPSNAPGATDNACGVAIVMEAARVMSQYRFNRTVAFALWNGEEMGRLGSNSFAGNMAESSMNVPLYLNFDSPCYDPEDRFVLDIMYDDESAWAGDMLARNNAQYGINFTLTCNAHHCTADHLSFWSHGYPAVMTHAESHGPAHTSSDSIDEVSSRYALKNCQLGMTVLAQVAGVQDLRTDMA